MARRKGWESLSETYRGRLIRNGINQAQYEAGAAIGKARRGRAGAPGVEAYGKRVTRFLDAISAPSESRGAERSRLMALGPVKGGEYIKARREMIQAYESGDYVKAKSLYGRRPKVKAVMYRLRRSDNRIVDATWWYHGIFGG